MKSLSIIIPLYNEFNRLNVLFFNIIKFIKSRKYKVQFILVDDGSTDNTNLQILNFKKKIIKNYKNVIVDLIFNKKNFGKGYSIRMGSKKIKYDYILTCDADLSVKFEQLDDWIKKKYVNFQKKNIIYFASRNHPDSNVKKKIYRSVIGSIYNFINHIFFNTKCNDTQCGFKLFPNQFKNILRTITINRFGHDIEIYNKIIKKKGNVEFLPVKWVHKNGSKVNLLKDSIDMFLSSIKIKFQKND